MYVALLEMLVGLTEHILEGGIVGSNKIFKIPSAWYFGGGISYTG